MEYARMTTLNYGQECSLRTVRDMGIECLPMTIPGSMGGPAGAHSLFENIASIAPYHDISRLVRFSQIWLGTALIVGTGAVVHLAPIPGSARTGVGTAILPWPEKPPAQAAVSVSQSLAVIRAAFSLQISQIAEILDVSRPTIYAWINQEQQPQIRHRDRLKNIFVLAKFWNTKSTVPLGAEVLLAPDAAGATLIDCLKAPEINLDRLKDRLQALHQPESMEIVPSRAADLARKYGIALDQNAQNCAEIAVMTRPPMDET